MSQSRYGGAGKAIGLTQGDILGVSSAIIEMGINAERGGTAFVRLNKTCVKILISSLNLQE